MARIIKEYAVRREETKLILRKMFQHRITPFWLGESTFRVHAVLGGMVCAPTTRIDFALS
jgi:hypothetical protein